MAWMRLALALALLLWTQTLAHQQEEEIFLSDRQHALDWTSEPPKQWRENRMRLGSAVAVPLLQACRGNSLRKTIIGRWMERKGAHRLLMDVTFTQGVEPNGQLHPLHIYLDTSDTPISRFVLGGSVAELQNTELLPEKFSQEQISRYLRTHRALDLGMVQQRGFQLAFSYSGPCVFITSIRLYYKRCADITDQLVSFRGTAAGSASVAGSCVEGAVEVSPPVRECTANGSWGPVWGRCSCRPGHQVENGSCRACPVGYYKPTPDEEEEEGEGGCRPCPENKSTLGEGAVMCSCVQGFLRLPTEPHHLRCTKPPSAPTNLTVRHFNASALTLSWDPPRDWGGRQEVSYSIQCEREEEAGGRWGPCPDEKLPSDSAELSSTSVSVSGLSPWSNYRLSVQARNNLSSLQGAPPPSTAIITIHKWKFSGPTPTTSGVNVLEDADTLPHQSPPTLAVVLGVLLILPALLAVVWLWRHHKSRSNQVRDLTSWETAVSYHRPRREAAQPQQSIGSSRSFAWLEGMAPLLEGFSDRLLLGLKDVLVERDRLTLGKELGKGAFGLVYEGVFIQEEGVVIKVAVKTMRVGTHSHHDLEEFLREAELMQNFHHENVVRLLGVTLQREQERALPVPLMILPYMKYGDLRRFLIETRYGDVPLFVPHQSLLRFMIDVAAGMEYLSSRGFLHRDLAARNCMLSDDLRVCVADFGLSKQIYSANYYRQNSDVCVPVKWMAMESLSQSIYTTKSDIWSFGVTMWEIVSRGMTPYPGVQNCELLDLLQTGVRLKQPSDCDQPLYEVMRSCWDEDPGSRPSFSELLQMLKGLLAELPELEASQEVNYINQVLAVLPEHSPEPGGSRHENTYLPCPAHRQTRQSWRSTTNGGGAQKQDVFKR